MPVPIAGRSEKKPISTPHRSAPSMPRAAQMIPPQRPCRTATTTVPATEVGAQKIFNQADHEHAAKDHDRTLEVVAGRQEINSYRNPDDAGADRRKEREEAHQHAP